MLNKFPILLPLSLAALALLAALYSYVDGGSAAAGDTERVSVDSAGAEADAGSANPAISADARYVALSSDATNLVPGDTNGKSDVFVRDRLTGATERVSVDSAGNQGNDRSYGPDISADGRYVVFYSFATNLVPGDTNGKYDVFVHDRQTGATERVSVDSAGNQGDESGGSYNPAISADGRYVAFDSGASNLAPGDITVRFDVFVHDRQTGATERVSVDSVGNPGDSDSTRPAISASGRYVAFASGATNLVPEDTNRSGDVFVRDRGAAATATPTATPSQSATASPTPSGESRLWGDIDCLNGITIGDAQKIARDLIDLAITQAEGCPQIGSTLLVAGIERIWGDIDCLNGVTIGDAQKIARDLIDLAITQAEGCPRVGEST